MPNFTIRRMLASPVDRVWALAGNFLNSPGSGIEVKVGSTNQYINKRFASVLIPRVP